MRMIETIVNLLSYERTRKSMRKHNNSKLVIKTITLNLSQESFSLVENQKEI